MRKIRHFCLRCFMYWFEEGYSLLFSSALLFLSLLVLLRLCLSLLNLFTSADYLPVLLPLLNIFLNVLMSSHNKGFIFLECSSLLWKKKCECAFSLLRRDQLLWRMFLQTMLSIPTIRWFGAFSSATLSFAHIVAKCTNPSGSFIICVVDNAADVT